jgi:phosphoenolpyruvate carboxykinase (GTP)
MRVLKWIVERTRTMAAGMETPLGRVPVYGDMDWRGLENFSEQDFDKVMSIDKELWKQEILSHEELFIKLYDRLPKELLSIRELLLSSLWSEPEWLDRHE